MDVEFKGSVSLNSLANLLVGGSLASQRAMEQEVATILHAVGLAGLFSPFYTGQKINTNTH